MKNKILGNALWIIVMQCVKALVTLGVSMLTTRLLGPTNFGLINYAASIVSFVAPIMYLGFNSTLVRELVHNPEKEGETLGTAIGASLVSGVLCIGLIAGFVCFANAGERETLLVCTLYSILLIFQSVDLILYWFQAKLMSKYSSIASLGAYLIIAAYKICILVLGKDIYWLALSSAIEYMLVSTALLFIYKRLGGQGFKFSFCRLKSMFDTSHHYIVASMMVSVSAYIDRIMIKLMISDTANGYYSAAVTCAAMVTFIFVAIIDSFRPAILENKQKDHGQYVRMVKLLYSVIIYLSLIQCVVFFILATPIVRIVCGESYAVAIPLLRIVVWYTPFSYLAAARNVWILAENKQRYLWVINLSSAIVNICTNLLLIPLLGVFGAAIASLISNFFVIVIMNYLVKPLRANAILLIQAANPKMFFGAIKMIVNRNNKKV